ncbi:hypothetical protein N9L68_08180 [bacterium]|nr:hypothetical protein [bacterium]
MRSNAQSSTLDLQIWSRAAQPQKKRNKCRTHFGDKASNRDQIEQTLQTISIISIRISIIISISDTSATPARHQRAPAGRISISISISISDTSATPARHQRGPVGRISISIIISISDTSATPSRHHRDTSATPARHQRDTSGPPPDARTHGGATFVLISL